MNTIKMLHTADWHFDCKFSGIHNQKIRRKLQIEQRETFLNVINLAIQKKVDFFLIAGDLFEQNSFRLETIKFIMSVLSALKCPVLITPGNHDPYIKESPYQIFNWGNNIHIYSKNEFTPFTFDNTVIYGIANTMYKYDEYCLEHIQIPYSENKINIVMFHGTYEELIPFFFFLYISYPFNREQLKKLNAGYTALGHFHGIKDMSVPNSTAYYPGTPQGTSFKESGARYVIIAELTPVSCKAEKIQVNQREFIEHKFDISGITNMNSLYEELYEEIIKIKHVDDLLRIILTGNASFDFNIPEIEARLADKFFYVCLENRTSPSFDLVELKKSHTLVGEFINRLEEKINNTPNEENKIILKKAINYGLKALLTKEEIILE
ncbi:DNA repair exonuclease [Candidatus Desantisbacteria bacterium]|nr:DNA repair exonuclease [Candidatus Desantisbacteria bacterium]